jgi:hypothetical protein
MWYSVAAVRQWDVVRTDDRNTGFSESNPKRGRPYLVTRIIGDPPELIYVLPRTASGWEGVPTPARVLPGLRDEGNFLLDPIPVDPQGLADAEMLGQLPEPYLSRVQERLTDYLMDIE